MAPWRRLAAERNKRSVKEGIGRALRIAHKGTATDERMQELIEELNKVGGRDGDSR